MVAKEALITMTPHERWSYKLAFALKVRSAYGTQFQDFFSTVMERRYGADFVRIRPFGSLGDKGCDGYLRSTGCVFQCYGKLEDAPVNVSNLVSKAKGDYALAAGNLTAIMKEWHFGHNLVNGVPVELAALIEGLQSENPHHQIGLVGPASLEERVFELDREAVADLLGPAATAEDTQNLRLEAVAELIDSLMVSIDATPILSGEIRPVPVDKVEFNKLPQHWVGLITAGMQNAAYVRHYINSHHDAEIGEKLARAVSERYRSLKHEQLSPGQIMDRLYEGVTGVGSVSTVRQVAAQALLAYLFESCDIFEDQPSKVAA